MIWFTILLTFLFKNEKFRDNLVGFFKLVFNKTIITIFLVLLLYLCSIVFLLNKINFWDITLLKDTIIWFLFTGNMYIFNYIKYSDPLDYLKKVFKDNLKVVIIFEFLINSSTFSLFTEIIILPIITLIFLLESFNKDKRLEKFFNILNFLLGLLFILNTVKNYSLFREFSTFKSFLLSPFLSISFLPIIFILIVVIGYESLFKLLEMGKCEDKKVKKYAKYYIFKACMFNPKKIKQAQIMGVYNLMSIQTMEDVKKMRKNMKN